MKEWCKNLDCLQFISLAMLLGLVLLTYTNRVDDLDLWWHLKTGEVVVKDLSLPKQDAFSYTSGATINLSEQDLQALGNYQKPSDFQDWGVNLRQSWLGQVVFYLAFAAGGLFGVGLLKALVFVLTFLVLYWAMRRKGGGTTASLLVTLWAAVIGLDFAHSRPQIFTFLLLALLFYLFADFKGGGRKFMALPALFLFWSNIHGGFVVGACLLLIFWSAETCKYLLHGKFNIFGRSASPGRAIRQLSLISLSSFIAMLLNPNHYKIFLVPFAIKPSLFSSIEEYTKPMLYEYHAYWLMLAMVLIFFVLLIKFNDITDILLISFLLIMSQMGIRGIILFVLGAAPFMAASLSTLWHWFKQSSWAKRVLTLPTVERFAFYRPDKILFLLLLLHFGVTSAQGQGFWNFKIKEGAYPADAVTFLRAKNYPGRMFNSYNWGGYLIWEYPERPVFIDGRCLDEVAFFHSQLIHNAQGSGKVSPATGERPLWKRMLDAYGVQIILTTAVTSNGHIVPLVDQLSFDTDWALVYQDGTALIYLRDTPANRSAFGRDYLPKTARTYDEIFSESQRGLAEQPATWGYYELLGFVYMNRRDLVKSREMYEKYVSMDPNNISVIKQLNTLRGFSGEAPLPVPKEPTSPHNW